MRRRRSWMGVWAGAGAIVLLVVGGVARGDAVRVRSSVVLDADAPVRVSDVAVVEGDEAVRAGAVILADRPGALAEAADGRMVVSIERVRRALADAGFLVARMAISGNACVVRVRGASVPPVAEEAPAAAEREFQTIGDGPVTVRTRITEMIAQTYGVDRDAVRVLFDPRDETLLCMEEAGTSVIVRPLTTASSARPIVEVRVLSGERTVASGTVTAEVEIRRMVVVATGDMPRHSDELASLVRSEERWMAPGGAALVEGTGDVLGMRSSRRIRAGEVLRQTDIEGVIAVVRGEVVVVECVRNGVSIQTRARAMGDGRIGDRVECRIEGSRKSFVGTVDAVGRVVVQVGEG